MSFTIHAFGNVVIFSLNRTKYILQISCLRAEQSQLSKSLEKERQRAAENRQEYLAAKEEADTQEGRANQLEEEIRELRRKHKQELQDALMHRELLQQVVLLVPLYFSFQSILFIIFHLHKH
jgi:chromosome segregation ATPase